MGMGQGNGLKGHSFIQMDINGTTNSQSDFALQEPQTANQISPFKNHKQPIRFCPSRTTNSQSGVAL
jgi:hypothetical protein